MLFLLVQLGEVRSKYSLNVTGYSEKSPLGCLQPAMKTGRGACRTG
ncbi:Hypothetical protein CAP_0470 [Chondromyces apiculatus DSM 436]|uniref:Uncharacterized protein n=1 Tax=Chondromyces apiculatus DSM 436 TaxID=1192034 RepID=A0A017SW92_9BACT|nr:Hypothetical protein CAP_0470 [Chondromyces apiculatus DSM 436]